MEKFGVEVDWKIRYLDEKMGKINIIFLNMIFIPFLKLKKNLKPYLEIVFHVYQKMV